MAWTPTGTNNVPLGRRSRVAEQDDVDASAAVVAGEAASAIERARAIANNALGQPVQPASSLQQTSTDDDGGERKRRRKNRWGARDANAAVATAAATASMSKEQVESYAAVVRIDEITRRLKSGDVVPPDGQRSPSPPPTYNNEGKRTNTREQRYRRRLEEERMRLVEAQLRRDSDYKPPADYRRRSRFSEKVFIPVDENPGLNFIGLLIGPRGNTLKKIEGDSGCKISIRGRGSIKEGKRRDDASIPGADEDLHCHVVADSEDKVRRGVRLVNEIIRKACVTPEGYNDHKRNQLRELAALNGTLRDDEGQACLNCGALGHRRWECPDKPNVTVSLVCRLCGAKGHVARDCSRRHDPDALNSARERDKQLNSEYLSLMAELGEAAEPSATEQDRNTDKPLRTDTDTLSHANADPPSDSRAPWLRAARSHSRSRSPPPPRTLAPPTTPPWLRRRPPSHRGPPRPHTHQHAPPPPPPPWVERQSYSYGNSYSHPPPPPPSYPGHSPAAYGQPPPPPPPQPQMYLQPPFPEPPRSPPPPPPASPPPPPPE
ncbi:hypothetical protein H4R99_004733 [Coemansia sp. RSA 1722]|nr:hypothetical protein IWW45_000216 [Coemansia sp. RSA 485]KAJ2594586.1 hypothetical protein GGF39_004154 [Coemansia sp. RSA 1721]KAJ2596879.1 hypothetical protein H4R99_004733 [Coemansia sp. RSA 1722]